MTRLEVLHREVKELRKDLHFLYDDEILANQDQIVDLNTEAQLYAKGQRADGQKVRPSYTASTKKAKRRKNQPTDRVTLRDTGQFHQSFFIELLPGAFQISADDEKAPFLFKRYTTKIAGLTKESINEVGRLIAPGLLKRIRKRLNV